MEQKLDTLVASINDLKASQNKLINSVNEKFNRFGKKIDDLLERVSTLTTDNEALKAQVTTLQNKVQILEHDKVAFENKFISEFIDRNSRIHNIILFNLPEKSDSTNYEKNSVNEIMNAMGLNIIPTKYIRLGKISDKCRPLKLTLPNPSDVFSILRLQYKLKTSLDSNLTNLRFSSDRTTFQREQMANLRKELASRRENGEQNLIIKYIKGEPKIVSSSKN